MAHIKHDCPHCYTKHCGFAGFAEYQVPDNKGWVVAYRCNFCHEGLFIRYDNPGRTAHPLSVQGDPDGGNDFYVLAYYPMKSETKVPDHLPDNIKAAFTEAKDTLEDRRWNSAGMGFWRTLEIATKLLCPEHKKKTLYERLRKMSEKHMIPKGLFDVGDFIREQGNEAKHEETVYDEPRARKLERFAQLFLVYTFELPEEVKAVKGSSSEEEQGSGK